MEFMRDEETGDYVVDDTGRPESDTTLSPAIRTRLRGHRGKWMHAPDPTWGSDFWRYKKKRSVDFRDGLGESIALSATLTSSSTLLGTVNTGDSTVYGWNLLEGEATLDVDPVNVQMLGNVDYVDGNGDFFGFVTFTFVDGSTIGVRMVGEA